MVPAARNALVGDKLAAIDEGIINPMAIAVRDDAGHFDVLVIGGREARSIRRGRNKHVSAYQQRISRAKAGSKRHRRLVMAKKSAQGRARRQLRDFDHQVVVKARGFLSDKGAGRVVAGNLSGIEQRTKRDQRLGHRQRQQVSQWSRGRQERYLAETDPDRGGARLRARQHQGLSQVRQAEPATWPGLGAWVRIRETCIIMQDRCASWR